MDQALSHPTGASDAARRFLRAVVWGEHTTVWALLSRKGRSTALSVALGNGLDRVVAARIGDGRADPVELDEFLRSLLAGLRRDMRSVDVDNVTVAGRSRPGAGGSVIVDLESPSSLPGTAGWPAGHLELSRGPDGDWVVDRLHPRLAGR